MDFFEHQEISRRQTRKLVVLFLLAVVGTAAALSMGVLFLRYLAHGEGMAPRPSFFDIGTVSATFIATTIIVILGTLYRTQQLSKGGSAVASMLGGREVQGGSSQAADARLFNIVEEMSIASGVAMPRVYVLDNEPGINAFAAGFSQGDAIVAVTQGALNTFSRDELQAVVAHEFSHILNGDMRLNLRLMGVLFGILMIGQIGLILMRTTHFRSRSKSNNLAGGLLALGLLAWLLGSIGVFFARLIKAAVSRQREFLADASAVQFTRNGEAVAGALKRILAHSQGSRIESKKAEEASHLFFSQAMSFSSLFATHPPLTERIKRIDATFDPGAWSEAAVSSAPNETAAAAMASGFAPHAARPTRTAAKAFVDTIGQPTVAHIQGAQKLLAALPEEVHRSAQRVDTARALIYALLFAKDPAIRHQQIAYLEREDPDCADASRKLFSALNATDPHTLRCSRLPLVDLALNPLRQLDTTERRQFLVHLDALANADGRISLFEFCLRTVLHHGLFPQQRAPTHVHLHSVRASLLRIASLVAHLGAPDNHAGATASLHKGFAQAKLSKPELCSLQEARSHLKDDLEQLDSLRPKLKRSVLGILATIVLADSEITVAEAEILRALAAAMDCPAPPLLAGTDRLVP